MFLPFDPANTDDATLKAHPRGLYYKEDGRLFRYFLAEDAAIVATEVLCYATNYGADAAGPQPAGGRNAGEMTNTSTSAIDGTLATVNICSGVAMGSVTDDQFGLCAVSGLASAKTDGGVVKGDSLVVDGGNTPNGRFDTAVGGEEHAVSGMALADDVSTTVSCILRCIL